MAVADLGCLLRLIHVARHASAIASCPHSLRFHRSILFLQSAGVENLNRLLQEALNPSGSEVMARSKTLRVHDKVMQLRNDYEREVFNGDIGRIAAVDTETGVIVVDFDGRHVEYERADLDALTLAYAVSVHKSQGGEFPAVIVCLLTQHFPLLQRNLLYTAVTRGKRLVVIVGSRKAMAIALRNDTPRRRNSLLASRLASAKPANAALH